MYTSEEGIHCPRNSLNTNIFRRLEKELSHTQGNSSLLHANERHPDHSLQPFYCSYHQTFRSSTPVELLLGKYSSGPQVSHFRQRPSCSLPS